MVFDPADCFLQGLDRVIQVCSLSRQKFRSAFWSSSYSDSGQQINFAKLIQRLPVSVQLRHQHSFSDFINSLNTFLSVFKNHIYFVWMWLRRLSILKCTSALPFQCVVLFIHLVKDFLHSRISASSPFYIFFFRLLNSSHSSTILRYSWILCTGD